MKLFRTVLGPAVLLATILMMLALPKPAVRADGDDDETVNPDDLPAKVKAAWKKEYEDTPIVAAEKRMAGDKVVYQLEGEEEEATKGGDKEEDDIEALIDEDGHLVCFDDEEEFDQLDKTVQSAVLKVLGEDAVNSIESIDEHGEAKQECGEVTIVITIIIQYTAANGHKETGTWDDHGHKVDNCGCELTPVDPCQKAKADKTHKKHHKH